MTTSRNNDKKTKRKPAKRGEGMRYRTQQEDIAEKKEIERRTKKRYKRDYCLGVVTTPKELANKEKTTNHFELPSPFRHPPETPPIPAPVQTPMLAGNNNWNIPATPTWDAAASVSKNNKVGTFPDSLVYSISQHEVNVSPLLIIVDVSCISAIVLPVAKNKRGRDLRDAHTISRR